MSKILFNGTSSIAFKANGSISFIELTATPQISDAVIIFVTNSFYAQWKVINMDAANANVYSEYDDETPDAFTHNLNYNVQSALISQDIGNIISGGTIYAYAIATGKGQSEYAAVYIEY